MRLAFVFVGSFLFVALSNVQVLNATWTDARQRRKYVSRKSHGHSLTQAIALKQNTRELE